MTAKQHPGQMCPNPQTRQHKSNSPPFPFFFFFSFLASFPSYQASINYQLQFNEYILFFTPIPTGSKLPHLLQDYCGCFLFLLWSPLHLFYALMLSIQNSLQQKSMFSKAIPLSDLAYFYSSDFFYVISSTNLITLLKYAECSYLCAFRHTSLLVWNVFPSLSELLLIL